MPKAYKCPVLAQIAVKLSPADEQGNLAAGTIGDVKVVLLAINDTPAADPTAYIGAGDEKAHAYLQSTDNVGDILEFDISATLTTSSGDKVITERHTLAVVHQLEADQYRAIGSVAVAWALLEDRVHTLFATIISIEAAKARLIAAHVKRIDVLFSIMLVAAEKLDEAERKELDEIRQQVKDLGELRNKTSMPCGGAPMIHRLLGESSKRDQRRWSLARSQSAPWSNWRMI
jgi:hypothetical protein